MLFPACDATMVQVPAATGTMFKPDTVQTPGVSEVKVTVRPEVAVAPDAKLGEVGVFPPGLLKVMVWL